MLNQSPDYLGSTTEAAAYTHHSPRTYIRWRGQRVGPPYVRAGRHIRYRKGDIDLWLTKHRVVPVREEL